MLQYVFFFPCGTPNIFKAVWHLLGRDSRSPHPSTLLFCFGTGILCLFLLSTKMKAKTVTVLVCPLNTSLHFPRAREWIKEIMSLSLCKEYGSPRYWFCSLLNWGYAEVDRHVRRSLRLELLTPDLYISCNLIKSPLKACCNEVPLHWKTGGVYFCWL